MGQGTTVGLGRGGARGGYGAPRGRGGFGGPRGGLGFTAPPKQAAPTLPPWYQAYDRSEIHFTFFVHFCGCNPIHPRALPPSLLALCPEQRCDLCCIEFNGPSISSSHYNGKAHAKKVATYLETAEDLPEGQKPKKIIKVVAEQVASSAAMPATGLHCATCNLVCTSQVRVGVVGGDAWPRWSMTTT